MLTIEFHPLGFEDGRFGILMASCQDGFLRLWSVDMRRKSVSDPPMKYYCKTLARESIRLASFSNSGTRIVTGATDGIVRLLHTPSREEVMRAEPFPTMQPYVYFLDEHDGYVNCVHFSSDGRELLTAGWDGTVRLWTFNEANKTWTARCFSSLQIAPQMARRGRKVTMASFACDDRLVLAAVNELFVIMVWDKVTGALLHTLRHHTADIQILVPHPTLERVLLSASYDGTVAVWDMLSGRLLCSFKGRGQCKYLDGTFSPGGEYFALTDDIGRVSLFALGVSPDSFALAPDVQVLASDWLDAAFDDSRNPVDPLANRPCHLVPPRITCDLERRPNPMITTREFFQPVVLDTWMGSEAQKRQEALLKQQLESETGLFDLELSVCPPGYYLSHICIYLLVSHPRTRDRRNEDTRMAQMSKSTLKMAYSGRCKLKTKQRQLKLRTESGDTLVAPRASLQSSPMTKRPKFTIRLLSANTDTVDVQSKGPDIAKNENWARLNGSQSMTGGIVLTCLSSGTLWPTSLKAIVPS